MRGLAPQVAFKPDGRLIVGEFVSAIEWPLDRPTLQRFACQVAGRDMTRAEWEDVLPNQPYRRVCEPSVGTGHWAEEGCGKAGARCAGPPMPPPGIEPGTFGLRVRCSAS